jgi:phospholipid/cholesterol/gamma-HCH transport system substrate-binding protein
MMPPVRLIGIGVFVLCGTLLFALGLFLIGDRRLMFADQFETHAEFARLAGLQNGAPVRVNGMNAGEVLAIAIPGAPGGRFQVRMRIREDLRHLVRTDSIASIQTDGIVGNRFVQIEAGSEQAPVVAEGGTIASREPFDFADLLARGSKTIDTINATIIQLRDDLEDVVAAVGETAINANNVVKTVASDVEAMSRAGRRISDDTSRIVEGIRAGRGTIGKLMNDEELYSRTVALAREAEEAMRLARQAAEGARTTVANLQGNLSGPDGPMRSLVGDLRHTITSTRDAMSDLAENTEALKRNFLVRGYFQDRGFYSLDDVSVADYRRGVLGGRHREAIRIWLRADVLFEPNAPQDAASEGRDAPGVGEGLSAEGRVRLDRAMGEVLRYPRDTPLVIEGYAEGDTRDQRFLRATERARQVRDYLIARYEWSPNHIGVMPLGNEAEGSPRGSEWDGVGLALWVDRRVLKEKEASRTPER